LGNGTHEKEVQMTWKAGKHHVATRARRLKVKIADSKVTHKVCAKTKAAGKAVANGCGFVTYLLGQTFRPISEKVKEKYSEYKGDLTDES
jgi:hypothetical protein